jgi:arylsulfatase A
MTGRTPFRVGIFNWIPMLSPMHVKRSETTIATLLRNAGYDTCHVGKWHLNGTFNMPAQPQPGDHGFQHWFSTQNNALPNHKNPHNFVRNGTPVGPLKGYSAELVADESILWLETKRDEAKPFFLFVCFHEPHEPIATAKKYTDLYPSDDPSLSAHHGNVSQLDTQFGRIVDKLDSLGLRKDTIVWFTSDNGPAITRIHPHGSSGGLRDKKGAMYEGGIRVPGIIQWPGVVKEKSVSDVPTSGIDVLPTFCELANVELPKGVTLDGTSVAAILKGKTVARKKPLYWQFNRASSDMKVAIRLDRWKLLAKLDTPPLKPSGGITAKEMAELKKANLIGFELYDLQVDPKETTVVNDRHPETFQQLKDAMQKMYREVRDEAPTWPEWEFARYESKRIEWPDYWTNRRRNQEAKKLKK